MAKKRTTITVDEELLEFARRLGLNLSGFLEERLKDLRERLEGREGYLEGPQSHQNSPNKTARGEGFEPHFTSKF